MKRLDPSDRILLRNVMRLSSLGIHLVLCTAVGLAIGYYLDKWIVSTKPVLTIVFFLLGVVAGFKQIFVEVRRINRNGDNEKNSR